MSNCHNKEPHPKVNPGKRVMRQPLGTLPGSLLLSWASWEPHHVSVPVGFSRTGLRKPDGGWFPLHVCMSRAWSHITRVPPSIDSLPPALEEQASRVHTTPPTFDTGRGTWQEFSKYCSKSGMPFYSPCHIPRKWPHGGIQTEGSPAPKLCPFCCWCLYGASTPATKSCLCSGSCVDSASSSGVHRTHLHHPHPSVKTLIHVSSSPSWAHVIIIEQDK